MLMLGGTIQCNNQWNKQAWKCNRQRLLKEVLHTIGLLSKLEFYLKTKKNNGVSVKDTEENTGN